MMNPTILLAEADGRALRRCNAHRRKRSLSSTDSYDSLDSQISVDRLDDNKKPRFQLLESKKRVTFDLSHNTTSQPAYYYEDQVSDHDRWFSPHSLHAILRREARVVVRHQQNNACCEQIEAMLQVAISNRPLDPFGSCLQELYSDNCLDNTQETARGLEGQVVPCIRQRRKCVVQVLLQSQYSLQTWRGDFGEALAPEAMAEALAAHYHKLARPSRRVAWLLAQQDAAAASGK